MSDKSVLLEINSSGDGFAWRTVFTVYLAMEALREHRDEYLRLPVEERPKVESSNELPTHAEFAEFLAWLRIKGIKIVYGPHAVYGIDNPTDQQIEDAKAAREVKADVEFSNTSEPPTPLAVF